jgi:glutamate synthase (NADPH) large chain
MSLKTRFSNLGNILDDGATQEGVMVIDSRS